MYDIFVQCRESVSAEEVAQRYGLGIDRHGRTLCPYHDDHHPSMTFWHGRYRCWTCGAHGDAIDLTAHLLGLTPLEAVKQLNNDYMLGLPLDPRPPTPQEREEAKRRNEIMETYHAYEAWRHTMIRQLDACQKAAHLALRLPVAMSELTEAEALAIRWQATAEYWSNQLSYGNMEAQMQVFRSRKEIDAKCKKILLCALTKSGAV